MAVIAPTISNGCLGEDRDGEALRHFKCKENDGDYSCRTQKFFYVTCANPIVLCNQLSGAYVAAVTVCNQRLF